MHAADAAPSAARASSSPSAGPEAAVAALFEGAAPPDGPAAVAAATAVRASGPSSAAAAVQAVYTAAERLAAAADALGGAAAPPAATETFISAAVVLEAALAAGAPPAVTLDVLSLLEHARLDVSVHRAALTQALDGCVRDAGQAQVAAHVAVGAARRAEAGAFARLAALRFYLGALPALMDALPPVSIQTAVLEVLCAGVRAPCAHCRRAAHMCAAAAVGQRSGGATAEAEVERAAAGHVLVGYAAACMALTPPDVLDADVELHASAYAAAAASTPAAAAGAALLPTLSQLANAASVRAAPRACARFRALLAVLMWCDVGLIEACCDAVESAVLGMRVEAARREACAVLVDALRGSDDVMRKIPLARFAQSLSARCAAEAGKGRRGGGISGWLASTLPGTWPCAKRS